MHCSQPADSRNSAKTWQLRTRLDLLFVVLYGAQETSVPQICHELCDATYEKETKNMSQLAAARFPRACSSVALASESRHHPVRLTRAIVDADRQPPGHEAYFWRKRIQERTPLPTKHATHCLDSSQPRSKVAISSISILPLVD